MLVLPKDQLFTLKSANEGDQGAAPVWLLIPIRWDTTVGELASN